MKKTQPNHAKVKHPLLTITTTMVAPIKLTPKLSTATITPSLSRTLRLTKK